MTAKLLNCLFICTGGDKKAMTQSVESMHQFSDEGGGEADPLDISNIYSKLGDGGGAPDPGGEQEEASAGEANINQMGFGEAPAQIGSLSSVTDASEEFTGECGIFLGGSKCVMVLSRGVHLLWLLIIVLS